ncbi:MAG: phytoene desaturase family protein [Anaerolineae bacterium]
MSGSDPIIIIGAGIGGLSAAVRLAAAGQRVIIYEQNERVGGKMGLVAADGFRWDTGPTVITMRHVFEALFDSAGRRLEDYLTLEPVEPLTRYFYPDGVMLDATRDLARMAAQIERIEPRDVEGYLAYLAYAARIHRITGPAFIYSDPPTLARLLLSTPPREWLQVDPLRTMHGAIHRFVRSPHLRQLLGRFATYVGADPYQAPATLNVIAHIEMTGGVWYPRGGVYAIAEAMRRLAIELGVTIHTGAPVERILLAGDRAVGVRAAGGDVAARAVLANVDVSTVYRRLLPDVPAARVALRRLQRMEPSCSGFIMLLGVAGESAGLAHHNIFFSADYPAEFHAIFRRGVPPADPTIYVAITSKTDADHAPPGHENWFVLVNAPPLGPAHDWASEAAPYAAHVLDVLAVRHGVDVRGRVRVQRIITPADIARLTGAERGALYGISSNNPFAAFNRPHNRAPGIRGLYFAGGTAHPGGGVPMVTLSGGAAARLILADLEGCPS